MRIASFALLLLPTACWAQPFVVYPINALGDNAYGNQVAFDGIAHAFTVTDETQFVFASTQDEDAGKSAVKQTITDGRVALTALYQSGDGEVLLATIAGKRARIETFNLRTGASLGTLPPAQLRLSPAAASVDGPLPAALQKALDTAKRAPEWWRAAWPYHRSQIDQWQIQVESVNTELQRVPTADRAKLPHVNRLLKPPFASLDLAFTGNWRCRSFQANALGLYDYPAFNCLIRAEGEQWIFSKTTGSQRRHGKLYRDGVNRLVFLGGSSVNDDPHGVYSRADAGSAAAEPLESDSYGFVIQRGPRHLVMLLDTDGASYEVLELTR